VKLIMTERKGGFKLFTLCGREGASCLGG